VIPFPITLDAAVATGAEQIAPFETGLMDPAHRDCDGLGGGATMITQFIPIRCHIHIPKVIGNDCTMQTGIALVFFRLIQKRLRIKGRYVSGYRHS
jgi:hypothetical protein